MSNIKMIIYISNIYSFNVIIFCSICWMVHLMFLTHVEFNNIISSTYVQYILMIIYFQHMLVRCHNVLQDMLDGSSSVSNTC